MEKSHTRRRHQSSSAEHMDSVARPSSRARGSSSTARSPNEDTIGTEAEAHASTQRLSAEYPLGEDNVSRNSSVRNVFESMCAAPASPTKTSLASALSCQEQQRTPKQDTCDENNSSAQKSEVRSHRLHNPEEFLDLLSASNSSCREADADASRSAPNSTSDQITSSEVSKKSIEQDSEVEELVCCERCSMFVSSAKIGDHDRYCSKSRRDHLEAWRPGIPNREAEVPLSPDLVAPSGSSTSAYRPFGLASSGTRRNVGVDTDTHQESRLDETEAYNAEHVLDEPKELSAATPGSDNRPEPISCPLCSATFATEDEASDHRIAHQLQAEEDEQAPMPVSDTYYERLLSAVRRRPVVGERISNLARASENQQEDVNSNEEQHEERSDDSPLRASVGRPIVWIAAGPSSSDRRSGGASFTHRGTNSLLLPLAMLSEQFTAAGSAVSVEEWVARLRLGVDFLLDSAAENANSQPQNEDATPADVVASLPLFTYPDVPVTPEGSHALLTADAEACMVCLDEYKNDDQLRQLPCLHAFHVACIDPWLQRSTLCPACKRSVLPKPPSEPPEPQSFEDSPSRTSSSSPQNRGQNRGENRGRRVWRFPGY